MPIFRFLFSFLFLLFASLVAAQKSKSGNTTSSWLTLTGKAPLVIAKGGFSGLLPDSSMVAYSLAVSTGVPDLVLWCDVQLTKDGIGICAPDLKLDNCTSISMQFPDKKKTYLVNGVVTSAYFSVDYTLKDLEGVSLTQGIYSRPYQFDNIGTISTVEQVSQKIKPSGFWLNIQHDLFFSQHNLSMRSFVLSASRRVIIDYISSTEVSFLKGIAARLPSKTKLVFRFLGKDDTEPSTNQTYDSLLKNLTFIKTFASGILVPKYYIWQVGTNQYLLPHTNVVLDAHKEGLEIYASDFANDVLLSYNYSYDPLTESLNYIDNGVFSVDGMLTDFPITQSEAVGCFAHINKNDSGDANLTIISHNGASGIYPGSTDLAYQQAIDDGANIIDCLVQMTRDGIPICLGSINLVETTTILQSPFGSHLSSIPEINYGASGIFTFNLTWSEIKSLKPAISSPYSLYQLRRNPEYANAGSFMTLDDFLTFAMDKHISGILINIQNAAYLAEKRGLAVTDSVLNALRKAGYENQTRLEVTIQSTNSSVLNKFKLQTKYKRMYLLDEEITDALNSSIQDIKQVADSVALRKSSIYTVNKAFIVGSTGLVTKLQSFGLNVYAYYLRNEFISQPWDCFSDPTVEINLYYLGAGVNGIITDFPGTGARYKRNACMNLGEKKPPYMKSVPPGGLLNLVTSMPPALAPIPPLTDSDVEEPPLPSVSPSSPAPSSGENATTPTPSAPSGQQHNTVAKIVMSLIMLLGSLLLA